MGYQKLATITASPIVAIWVVHGIYSCLLDGPHLLSTYSRTYLDRKFYNQHKLLSLYSLIVFWFPALVIFITYTFFEISYVRAYSIIFAAIWGIYNVYHMIRQYHGNLAILAKQQNKHLSFSPQTIFIEKSLAWFLVTTPTLWYLYKFSPEIQLGYGMYFKIPLDIWAPIIKVCAISATFVFICSKKLKDPFLEILSYILLIICFITKMSLLFDYTIIIKTFMQISLFALVITTSFYLKTCLFNKQFSSYKALFLLQIFCVHSFFAQFNVPFVIHNNIYSCFHNIHYITTVWSFNKTKYNYSLKKFLIYLLISSIIIFLPVAIMSYNINLEPAVYFVTLIIFGIALHHYWLDAIIWRFKPNSLSKKVSGHKHYFAS